MQLDGESKKVPWGALLDEALNSPGRLSEAYRLFHGYSTGNQLLATLQLGDKLGPIATYKQWAERGRQVKKGEKAIALYMPVTIGGGKKKPADVDEGGDESAPTGAASCPRRVFVLRRYWFSLAQTEGEAAPTFADPPAWSRDAALQGLEIQMEPFNHTNGNVLGYSMATEKVIAVSPLSPHPMKTLVHEMAHSIMHAEARMAHGAVPPPDVREVEAESVAYIVCATLGMDTEALSLSRGYIQSWMEDSAARDEFAKKHASRVFSAANRIIQAGQCKALVEGEGEGQNAQEAA